MEVIKINYINRAICVLKTEKINGVVKLTEKYGKTLIECQISGLIPNHKHGFHIHECGDLTDGCESACAHYNPFNRVHGDRTSKERHVGDLGNIQTDIFGNASFSFEDDLIKLSGPYSVIGRSIIIHQDEDDLGLGNHKDSLKTGHSGKRIVCGIIGWRKN